MFAAYLSLALAAAGEPGDAPKPPIISRPLASPPAPVAGSATAAPRIGTVALFSEDDYPIAALHLGEQGTVQVELLIGKLGRVENCRILQSSNSAALDVATCNILRRRARYSPARDASGQPVEDRLTVKIRWQLPGGVVAPFMPWVKRMIVRLDARHQPVSCRYEYDSQGNEVDQCASMFREASAMLAAAPKVPDRPVSLIFEHRFETGVAAPLQLVDPATDDQLLSADAAEFEVDRDGKLANCRTVVRQGSRPIDLCTTPFNDRFAPLEATDGGAKRVGRSSVLVYIQSRRPD